MDERANEKRKYLFTMRLNSNEKKQFERIAKEKGVSKAELVRLSLNFLGLNLFDDDRGAKNG